MRNDIQIYRKIVNRMTSELDLLKLQQEAEEKAQMEAALSLQACKKSLEIAQAVAQQIQQTAHRQISSVVSRCMEYVFGEGYGFKMNFVKKRNRTEAQLVIIKEGREEFDPLNEDSGGVTEVAAFALRVSCICLSKPKVRKLMVMDEPFKSVHSPTYRQKVTKMLEFLAEDFGIQIIMVTGVKEYETGNIIDLENM